MAPQEVIRAAYKALSQKYHPDKNPGDEKAARIMAILNSAYGTLADPQRRKEHDEWIAAEEWEIEWLESTRAEESRERGRDAPAQAWDKLERDGAAVIRLPDSGLGGAAIDRWLWIGPAAQAPDVLGALPALDMAQWQQLEVRSGVVPVVAATSGQFVPQMLNYELVGGVDFKKGCYPGQEIVARSHYLGKLKRRAFLLSGDAAMAPAQEVFWSEDPGQPAGVLARTAADGARHLALAELKIAVTRSGALHLGQPDGPLLQMLPLPYALPHDAETA